MASGHSPRGSVPTSPSRLSWRQPQEEIQVPEIAIFLPSLAGGGAERSLADLASGLVSKGYQVDLVLATSVGPLREQVHPLVNIVDLGSSRVAFSLPGLVSYLRRTRPTAMLSALDHTNLVALAAIWASRVTTRLVVSARGNPSKIRSGRSLRASLIVRLARLFYPCADRLHAVSEGVANSLVEHLGVSRESISVVYNPLVTPALLENSEKSLFDCLPEPLPSSFIVAAGRLAREKDFSSLIRAFALVRDHRDIALVILGEGELRSELEAEVRGLELEKHVVLPGFVTNPFPIFRAAEVFVLSSAWEGLPGVLVQSMAVGTPVVSTDCPFGPSEILENGKWGRLVPVGDSQSLASAIVETLRDTERPDVARRAQAFGLEKSLRGYLELLLPDTVHLERPSADSR